ncbi:IclR family transcriptional regulator [Shimazuella sp. AN120528]|uniref:IclR family transcriptional regulator n=1 Tax=Shimazuella soli TaxID=1892854 RepID=UPI001F0D2A3F|nr:IclR family transcriptional regulator [Shimazuella soli]MCH5585457.1 IclR family transcriptional regulator [Shimazuella soli]
MVQSIDRAMKIIQLLISDPHKSYWQISEIADHTELPLSTAHRLISSLIRYELVTQLPETKQYKIGNKWMEIGLGMLENLDFRVVARPYMEQLALEVEESIYLNIPNQTDSIIIERVDSPLKVRIIDNLGERIPLNVGAANKTILANMPKDRVVGILNQLITDSLTRTKFLEQLNKIHASGYALSYGEKTEGTASVAAPIIGYHNQIIGALSIGILSYTITEERLSYLISQVQKTAKEISIRLGKQQ